MTEANLTRPFWGSSFKISVLYTQYKWLMSAILLPCGLLWDEDVSQHLKIASWEDHRLTELTPLDYLSPGSPRTLLGDGYIWLVLRTAHSYEVVGMSEGPGGDVVSSYVRVYTSMICWSYISTPIPLPLSSFSVSLFFLLIPHKYPSPSRFPLPRDFHWTESFRKATTVSSSRWSLSHSLSLSRAASRASSLPPITTRQHRSNRRRQAALRARRWPHTPPQKPSGSLSLIYTAPCRP